MIGSKNNSPFKLIKTLLDDLEISLEKPLEKERNHLFERIINGLNGYDEDNIEILEYINNSNENRNDNVINNIEEDNFE
jgi:hypothetical protein